VEAFTLWRIKNSLELLDNLLVVVSIREGQSPHYWIAIEEPEKPLRQLRGLSEGVFEELVKGCDLCASSDHANYYKWRKTTRETE
jgi:hypothetical protein